MYQIGDRVGLEIPAWLAEERGFDIRFIEGSVKAVTLKALLVELDDGDEVWIPLSEVQ